jgi:hypothetical protein
LISEKETYIYDLFGNLKNILTIGAELKDSKIIDYRCFNTINTYTNGYATGIVYLTSKMKYFMIKDIYNIKLQKFPDIPGAFLSISFSFAN